jgi:hypothetical protein
MSVLVAMMRGLRDISLYVLSQPEACSGTLAVRHAALMPGRLTLESGSAGQHNLRVIQSPSYL